MILVSNNSTKEDLYYYWQEVMHYRMEDSLEVVRLINIVKGFYYQHLVWEEEDISYYKAYTSLSDFCKNSKRPFGNKNTTQSIIFHLGWDTQWVMRFSQQPKWVSELAEELYEKVVDQLIEEEKL